MWDKGSLTVRIKLPAPVAAIYRAVDELEAAYPGRKFTPDGHLVGSIGEVVAAEVLGLTLYPGSHPIHDAYDENGDVQIKMTACDGIAMYGPCKRLVVLRVVSPEEGLDPTVVSPAAISEKPPDSWLSRSKDTH